MPRPPRNATCGCFEGQVLFTAAPVTREDPSPVTRLPPAYWHFTAMGTAGLSDPATERLRERTPHSDAAGIAKLSW